MVPLNIKFKSMKLCNQGKRAKEEERQSLDEMNAVVQHHQARIVRYEERIQTSGPTCTKRGFKR